MSTHGYEMRRIEEIKPSSRNARTHSKDQIKQVTKSIERFGFINPVVIDIDCNVVAGHARLMAAQRIGLEEIPCLEVSHLDENELRAYMLADNKIAENAGWDEGLLKVELEYLSRVNIDIEIDDLGFSVGEVDIILGHAESKPDAEEIDEALLALPEKPITQSGDIWQLGPHRVACGDCRDPHLLAQLMGTDLAHMVFTDPPYNVPIQGHVSGLGDIQHPEFAMASGEMSDEEFLVFLGTSLEALRSITSAGSLHYICMDWRHLGPLIAAGRNTFDSLENLCVWSKTNAGMGSLYRSQHEMVLVFKHGKVPHINNVKLGKDGRYRTNVWTYPGVNTFSKDRDETLALHPTVKPTQLVADAILDVTKPGDLVVDGFVGSGTTILAAEKTQRRCYGIEIDPHYVDVALRRWVELTGGEPIHLSTGESFSVRQHDQELEAAHV
jgi:DNA modification methylase